MNLFYLIYPGAGLCIVPGSLGTFAQKSLRSSYEKAGTLCNH